MTLVNSAQVVWYGPSVLAQVKTLAGKRIQAAGIHLKNRIREKMSRSQPTSNQAGKRDSNGRFMSGGGTRKRGLDPSKPGEYPKIVTGFERRNVNSEYDAETMTSRVGTNVPYGRMQEVTMNPKRRRPWLSNSLRDFGGELTAVIESGKVPAAGGGDGGGDGGGEG